jgi:hypothetical protein
MNLRLVQLPDAITLVPSGKLDAQVSRVARDYPHLKLPVDPQGLIAGLNAMTGGVPTTFSGPRGGSRGDGDWSLLLHLRLFVVRLFLTKKYRDAYAVAAINPMRINDHHRVAQGCLMVRPAMWQMVYDVQQIPQRSNAHWPRLVDEWNRLNAERAAQLGAGTLTSTQAAALDLLDQTIDATEKIEMTAMRSARPFPYRDITSTGERRHGTRSIYVFRLTGGPTPEEGTFVQIRGEPHLRGQVTRVGRDRAVTVRFDDPVDWARLATIRQGELEVAPSRVMYAKQREAVALLRTRQARNVTVLPALIDGKVEQIPPARAEPEEDLDPEQREAFRKGLATRDVLAVLGPPGTGKTLVISQLASKATTEQHERVLITSHTNRAVDNALARLPAGLAVVRVGNEGKVTAEGQPYLLERQASELRKRVVDEAGPAQIAYAGVRAAQQWTQDLDVRVDDLMAATGEESRARAELAATRRAAGGAAQVRVDELRAELDRHDQAIGRLQRKTKSLAQRSLWWRARAEWPLLGALFGMRARLLERRRHDAEETAERLRTVRRQAVDALEAAERELDAVTRNDPSVQAAGGVLAGATHRRDSCLAAAHNAARQARSAVGPVETPPPVREGADRQTQERDLADLRTWLHQVLPWLDARATLLGEWREEISGATDQLYPELIRYADVIAATCIGAASRPELSGVDFDLAIVDEAGQIGIADALVPLVRARRGVLVGDHKQLPPFLNTDVEAWGASIGDPRIRELLAMSALEHLVEQLPEDHVVQLTRQRRMPAVIADFVSAAFYENRLRTAIQRDHRDALFSRAMAFVDTARLPTAERFERPAPRRGENWNQAGYVNTVEADLLVELAVHYHRSGADWAVILPYRAQTAKITAALSRKIGDPDLVNLNVGTVDSFQGGEREVILYGFTRSNPEGKVGFLRELRRTNVAFSRAQHQLVLVGDMTTLTNARDRAFRELAESLRDYLARNGDIRQYQDIRLVKKPNKKTAEA